MLIKRPVSTGALAVADASTLSVPFGDEVLLPVGSTSSWKRGETTDIEDELKAELLSLMICELKPLEAVAVPCGSKRTCPFSVEVPTTVIGPSTVRVALGVVVPMPTEVPLSKRMELTMVFAPENLAILFAVPPVVVTVIAASGVAAGLEA